MFRFNEVRAIWLITLAAAVLVVLVTMAWRGWEQRRERLEIDRVRTLAARMANDEFERRFQQRPFRAEMYEPELRDDRWLWGKFEPAEFYSAEVSFRRDITDPRIRVFWATDSSDIGTAAPSKPLVRESMPKISAPR